MTVPSLAADGIAMSGGGASPQPRQGTHQRPGASEQWLCIHDATVVDAGGRFLTPGLVDIHVHGGGGYSFTESPEALACAAEFHLNNGSTSLMVSLVSAEIDTLQAQLRDAADATATIAGSTLTMNAAISHALRIGRSGGGSGCGHAHPSQNHRTRLRSGPDRPRHAM